MKDQKLTPDKVLSDFYDAYEAKRNLLKHQKEDFEFRLGNQWKEKDKRELEQKGVFVVTDNRVQANVFLLTGLERQNRSDIKAFPEGQEDSVEADIATTLIKNAMKVSDGNDKLSEAFDSGVTVGESGLEMYLDATYNFLNPKVKWKKVRSDMVFPEPGWCEYDYSDCSFVYKWTRGIKKYELIGMYPEKKKKIEDMEEGVITPMVKVEDPSTHVQYRDYPTEGGIYLEKHRDGTFDLLERYYKKWVERVYVIDKEMQTLELVELEEGDDRTEEQVAKKFVKDMVKVNPQSAGRYTVIKRMIPEIWVYAMTGGMSEPLVDERAWFFPKWKGYPFMNFFAHWTDAILDGEENHLNVQGIVRGVKSTQMLHNKSETLKLRHLNSSANSGWLEEEGSWVDPQMVREFGSSPGVNLSYKRGRQRPERIFPMQISGGHELISRDTTEAIKAQLGINSDLLAAQQGRTDSGRAIALRQRQGVVMVQKIFDNLSRTRRMMGRFILSQLGEIYTIESAKKVLGEAYIQRTFGQQVQDPLTGQTNMEIDESRLIQTIEGVMKDAEIGRYDVAVGEAITTETKRMADFAEIQQFAQAFPGLITPDMVIKESNLPPNVKDAILSSFQQRQAAAAQASQTETAMNSPVLAAQVANKNGGRPQVLPPGGRENA